MDIKKSLKVLFETEPDRKSVDEYARKCYDEKFPSTDSSRTLDTYHIYDTFEVVSETQIRVKYSFGGGDMAYDDSFVVEVK